MKRVITALMMLAALASVSWAQTSPSGSTYDSTTQHDMNTTNQNNTTTSPNAMTSTGDDTKATTNDNTSTTTSDMNETAGTSQDLPATASPLPLLLLGGVGALATSFWLRRRRRA